MFRLNGPVLPNQELHAAGNRYEQGGAGAIPPYGDLPSDFELYDNVLDTFTLFLDSRRHPGVRRQSRSHPGIRPESLLLLDPLLQAFAVSFPIFVVVFPLFFSSLPTLFDAF